MSQEILINWECKTFDALSSMELYHIMWLRNEVFVVEQKCIFQDADFKDEYCLHLSGYCDGAIVAYARIVPPGASFKEPSIGRVVTSPKHRRNGVGKALLAEALEICNDLHEGWDIRVGAQLYLKNFYEAFNFVQDSEIYLEDGIEHIEMLRKKNKG